MDKLLKEVLKEADRLGLVWWERIVLILLVALMIVSSRRLIGLFLRIDWTVTRPSDRVWTDDGGPPGEGVPIPTDPENPGGDSYGG